MPELPDITVYIEALERRLMGKTLLGIRLGSPFLLRSVDPPLSDLEGKHFVAFRRLGKRIAMGLEDELWLVLHLMIAGRLHWYEETDVNLNRLRLAAFDLTHGTLILTEAGKKRRAALHVVRGREALAAHNPGGLEVLEADVAAFATALTRENHTLKRALTDPRLLSGIGNAYSDEILHFARLSPIKLTGRLTSEEIERLYMATQQTVLWWTDLLRAEAGEDFPKKVTAFRKEMKVHGRYGKPCLDCGTPVQRIRYASNETNYCARCQTDGRLLADRALSRLLKKDWPRTIDELERLGHSPEAGR